MTDLGTYLPGRSPIHRLPAGVKLFALFVAGVGSLWLRSVLATAIALVVVVVLYAIAGFGPRRLARQLLPLTPLIVILGAFQWIVAGWRTAFVVVGTLVALILIAGLVTLTTRTTDLVAVIVKLLRPFRRIVDPERIGLLLALGIRAVPVVLTLGREVREAQLARGLRSSPRAFAVPLIVRSLRKADALGEALIARGVDD